MHTETRTTINSNQILASVTMKVFSGGKSTSPNWYLHSPSLLSFIDTLTKELVTDKHSRTVPVNYPIIIIALVFCKAIERRLVLFIEFVYRMIADVKENEVRFISNLINQVWTEVCAIVLGRSITLHYQKG